MVLFLLSLLLVTAVHGRHVHAKLYDLELKAKLIAPDGFERSAALVNGEFPAPLLTAEKGDIIQVNVKNSLSDPTMRRSTSIHWHGIFQPRNAQNDGPAFVTQCPIAPNQTFLYTIIPEQQTGSFWYHSHLSTQYIDGIRGPLVIYDPNDPQKYLYDEDDENTVITLADWFHPTAFEATKAFFAGGPEPGPDSGLINGVGRFTGGPQVPWARINVVYGKRYRFRLFSMTALAQTEVQFANHSMTVIEADGDTLLLRINTPLMSASMIAGIAHQPYTVDSIQLIAGQRYSVIVNANQSIGNYWFSGAMSSPSPAFHPLETPLAVIHYEGAPDADPTAPPPNGLPPGGVEFQEFNLIPLENPGAPGGDGPADQTINLTIRPDIANAPNADIWLVNEIQYKSPTIPTLLNILANGFTNQSQFGENEHTFVLQPNSVIELVVDAGIFGKGHAMHLHGHAFDIIQSESGPLNFKNPPRRDVVSTGNQPIRLRFKTDNPGPWIFHCHLEYHLAAGLAVVLAEDPRGIQHGPQSVKPNEQWEELCNIYNNLPTELQ